MAQINIYNVMNVLKERIEQDVKTIVTDKITSDLVKDFENEVRPKVVEMVNKVSIDYVKTYQDYMSVSKDIEVYVKWIEDEQSRI